MRRMSAVLIAMFAALFGLATAAHALTGVLGNPATDRTAVDSWINFTIVDKNAPAPFDGTFTEINYYAERAGDIRFVIVDTTDTITWVSDVIPATAGAHTATFTEPVGLTAGSNLGVYSAGAGVVSFEYNNSAAPAEFEGYNVGLPAVGETLNYVGESKRIYSMNASIEASSPEVCKDGGWEMYDFKNQGQCIASIVANENSGK